MKNYIIGGLCLVIAGMVLAYLFRTPPPVPTGNLTIEQENELRASVVTLEGRFDSLKREFTKASAKNSVQQEAHKRAVQPFKKVAKKLERDPEVIKVRDSLPKIDSLLKAKDSIIVHHEQRISELETTLQVTKQLTIQMQANFEERLEAKETLLSESQTENLEMRKQNRKLKAGRVLRNVIIPVALGVGVWIGLQGY